MADFDTFRDQLETIYKVQQLVIGIQALYTTGQSVIGVWTEYVSTTNPTLTALIEQVFTPTERVKINTAYDEINTMVDSLASNVSDLLSA